MHNIKFSNTLCTYVIACPSSDLWWDQKEKNPKYHIEKENDQEM